MQTELEHICKQVIGAAIEVHRHLGPGLLESAYESCLALEFDTRCIPYTRQVALPIIYKAHQVDGAYRLDFVVAEKLIVELKAIEGFDPIHTAQALTYLRLARLKLALLVNFNVPLLRNGIKRVIL